MASRTTATKRKWSQPSTSANKKASKRRNVMQATHSRIEDMESSCIDLTDVTDEVEVVDLTTVNDSPVVLSGGRLQTYDESANRTIDVMETSTPPSSPSLPYIDFGYVPPKKLSPRKTTTSFTKINCPICLDDTEEIFKNERFWMSTICGHIFCNQCIKQAIRETKCCPSCRKKLTQRQAHAIFL